MQDSIFEGTTIEDIDVTARVAESELRQIWRELGRVDPPGAEEVRARIERFAHAVVAEAESPVTSESSDSAAGADRPEIQIYVLELDRSVLREERFERRNRSTYLPGQDCLYVGHTDQSLQYRFLQHLEYERASPFVHKYGLRFRPEFYAAMDPLSDWEIALDKVVELGIVLQGQGYGVWYQRPG